jgi:MFS transporter, OFA family, oxalate/formate antiporter
MRSATPRRLFRGWLIVAAVFAVTFLGFGSAYTFSSFFQPLQLEFGAARGSVALVFAIAGFLYFIVGVISGPLADRWGARPLVMLGMLLTGAGLLAASAARSLEAVFLAYGIGVGLGVGCVYVPAVSVVQRWFVRRRALASGLAVSGIGAGTLVMPLLASVLIDAIGWRSAYLVLGALTAIVGAGVSLLIDSDPRDRGLTPDGLAGDQSPAAAAIRSGASLREAVASSTFRILYVTCLISAFAVFVPFVHLVPYALDRGIDSRRAALLISLVGVGSTAGRFVLGSVADWIGRLRFLVVTCIGMALALAIWAGADSFARLAVFALAFGAFYGGWVAILPTVVMDRFGSANISSIIGVLYTSVALGTLAGPTVAGVLFDRSGSYALAIGLGCAANTLAAGLSLILLRKKPGPERSSAAGVY